MSSKKSFLKKWGAMFDYRKPSKNCTMDILVVKSKTGELKSSSFHVTFGWKIIKPTNKEVDLIVNGEVVDVKMKLSKKRKAFFEIPDELEMNQLNWSTDCNFSEDDIMLMSCQDEEVNKNIEENHKDETSKNQK
jgi:phosphatidate phosphatase PAH1